MLDVQSLFALAVSVRFVRPFTIACSALAHHTPDRHPSLAATFYGHEGAVAQVGERALDHCGWPGGSVVSESRMPSG
jgi:hypothetical protein